MTPLATIQTPRAAFTISACGDGNPRVLRLQFPRAAFEFPAGGVFFLAYRIRTLCKN